MGEQDEITDRLIAMRRRSGLSRDEVARRGGWRTGSGYQHYENPEKFTLDYLPLKVTRRLLKAFVGEGNPKITEREVLALSQLRVEEGLPNVIRGGSMAVAGNAEAGVWTEEKRLVKPGVGGAARSIPLGMDPRYEGQSQYAIHITGDCGLDWLQPGDYAVCAEVDVKTLRNGDKVLVRRRRHGMVETSARLFQRRGDVIELMPDSANQEHLIFRINLDGKADAEIVAKIIGRYAPSD